MKKILLCSLLCLTLISHGTYASPTIAESKSLTAASDLSVSDIYLYSTDSNEIIEVQNIKRIIEGKVDLSNPPTSPNWIIAGINDDGSGGKEDRTCVYCWLFALAFGAWLLGYGVWLRRRNLAYGWFKVPILSGVILYILHAMIHMLVASPIFLSYYWMILFDELLLAYIVYCIVLYPGPQFHKRTLRA